MARKNTNKQYSLRKLKKGTASVAVALSVLGAGLASQTEVKAETAAESLARLREEAAREVLEGQTVPASWWYSSFNENKSLHKDIETLERIVKTQSDTIEKEVRDYNNLLDESRLKARAAAEEIKSLLDEQASLDKKVELGNRQLEFKNAQISELVAEAANLNEQIEKLNEEKVNAEEQSNEQLEFKNQQIAELVGKKAELEAELAKAEEDRAMYDRMIEAAKRELAELQTKLDESNADKAKLESETAILEKLIESGKRELAEQQAKLDAANADNAKLAEDKQVLEASRKRTNRDLEAARDAKKATEAELADANAKVSQLQEEKQILEASRTRTNRDLEASRAAKQKVEAELEAAKAEVAALKEKLAKQAEDMAKKPEMPGAPEKETMDAHKLVPATKVVKDDKKADGKAAPVAKSETKAATNQLPSTGETANPFFTAAAMAVMATAGVVAVAKRKEEN
ncbi:YSIRK-type signal peptide-containing protein [Streptococcus dysgalactiae]|uniref:YSIRK-type signal peptide-containing protein n=1 Tax=Streptococcus dysgalactiae TaxID=1334 RepID=UPI003FD822AB